MKRKHLATQKEIWWELDKLAIQLASKGKLKEAETIEKAMELLERPLHEDCKRFYDEGY